MVLKKAFLLITFFFNVLVYADDTGSALVPKISNLSNSTCLTNQNTDKYIYNKEQSYFRFKESEKMNLSDITILKMKAENEDKEAQNILGALYYIGIVVEKSNTNAFYWFSKSANLNNPNALYNLARMYEYGDGVEKDLTKALAYYESAANLGEEKSLNLIGHLYEGYIYEELTDINKSVFWYRKAALLGNLSSTNNLAILYRDGLGVEKNLIKALAWMLIAGKKNYEMVRININNISTLLTQEEIFEANKIFEFWTLTGIYPDI